MERKSCWRHCGRLLLLLLTETTCSLAGEYPVLMLTGRCVLGLPHNFCPPFSLQLTNAATHASVDSVASQRRVFPHLSLCCCANVHVDAVDQRRSLPQASEQAPEHYEKTVRVRSSCTTKSWYYYGVVKYGASHQATQGCRRTSQRETWRRLCCWSASRIAFDVRSRNASHNSSTVCTAPQEEKFAGVCP